MTVPSAARSVLVVLFAATAVVHARQERIEGVRVPPLAAGPFEFETAEGRKIRVTVVARGLSHPWSLAFLPDGSMFVTERPGRLRTSRCSASCASGSGKCAKVRTACSTC